MGRKLVRVLMNTVSKILLTVVCDVCPSDNIEPAISRWLFPTSDGEEIAFAAKRTENQKPAEAGPVKTFISRTNPKLKFRAESLMLEHD